MQNYTVSKELKQNKLSLTFYQSMLCLHSCTAFICLFLTKKNPEEVYIFIGGNQVEYLLNKKKNFIDKTSPFWFYSLNTR